ncbi:MAG: hypothetical protein JSW06_11375 [Thermoplasmatales archaeon]|nr:MAG: hypothetical protein JSW06_11375 [Thermoplasmatales archaeon]
MGCKKGWDRNMEIKKIYVLIIVAIMITAMTPVVLGVHQDYITVTFNPSGDIDLDVTPATANFSTVVFSSEINWPIEGGTDTSYTLYNNGTVAADVFIFSNTTTDTKELTLENTGNPTIDQFCLNVTGSNAQQITNTNTSWTNDLVGGGGTLTFGINLELGSGSSDFGWQKTRINITGVIS